jgi:hypothetical protein
MLGAFGDLPGKGRRGRGFRRAQPDRVLVGTGPAGEVARDRPQAVAADRGCLAHADASHASGLMDPRAGLDQAEGAAHLGQVREDLP